MKDIQNVFSIAQFAVPMYTALICGLLFYRMYCRDESPLGRKNMRWVLYACAISVFGGISLTCYVALPDIFVFLSPFLLLAYMMVHVMYYRFIFEVTRINEQERFRIVHYIFPTLIFLVMVVWAYFVPFDVQLQLVESHGVWNDKYLYFSMFFTNKLCLFFLYDIIYASLGLYRTIRFRKVVINYSADEYRISLTWLYLFLFIMLVGLPMTVATLLLPNDIIISSGIALIPIAIIVIKDIILVHNILLENYVLIKSTSSDEKKSIENAFLSPVNQCDINNLEEYMRKKKPYLNPHLKITDMIIDLKTNRTTLSVLINRTYGMNFNRYINRWRLEELEHLKSDPRYSGYCEMELIALVGFSDYRGYMRVRKREEIEINI